MDFTQVIIPFPHPSCYNIYSVQAATYITITITVQMFSIKVIWPSYITHIPRLTPHSIHSHGLHRLRLMSVHCAKILIVSVCTVLYVAQPYCPEQQNSFSLYRSVCCAAALSWTAIQFQSVLFCTLRSCTVLNSNTPSHSCECFSKNCYDILFKILINNKCGNF